MPIITASTPVPILRTPPVLGALVVGGGVVLVVATGWVVDVAGLVVVVVV